MEGAADFIIVGAGSAGCVLANRLSADPGTRVLLIEAGGPARNPWLHIPVGYFRTMRNPAYDWCYRTEPCPGLNGRSIAWPRGKVLGGSSAINGLLYVRGQPQDYDRWRQMGNPGWGWDDVLPLFKRSENQARGADDFHDTGGELSVSDMSVRREICDAWIAAAEAAGYPFNPDYNGARQEGVGYFQLTAARGRRVSAATAFLKPARSRSNLQVITGALVRRVLVEDGRATGVVYDDTSGTERTARARREVILSAGAIGSPQLLMLSGIGPGATLQEMGLAVLRNAPEVGRNLQDHLQARLVFRCRNPTLNTDARSLLARLRMVAEYAIRRTGPMTMAASLATGFLRSNHNTETPDIQFHIQPWSADSPGEGVHPFAAFTASVCQLRPESRGEIRLASPDPAAHPLIHPNYLATPKDCQTLIAGIRIAARIAQTDPLRPEITGLHQPAEGHEFSDDDATLDWARQTATTIYHPTGTCRMGPDDASVVDPTLRVRAITGLRIADCAIMPEITSGNTNAPAIMIGEKAATLIRSGQ